ncbi:M23 family metallopeptidase, partial [Candidatus Gottesmanbacteria bacterium]|nr:M23 family metallopeptidase [Candidatus Gottesmanbacteria bacterium]
MLRTWLVVVAILIASIGTLFGVTVSDLQLKLPFPDGETWVISEGYFGAFSHCITCSGGKDIYALDFNLAGSSDLGRPILAPASGQVIQATCDSEEKMARKEGYGCRVKISLAGGSYHYLVAHLITITVAVGDMVQQGQQLGLCGETGFTTGPHVHTALYPIVDGKEVTSVAPEPMSNYTNFIEYEVGVHDADGDGKYTSTNVLVNPAYVGYFSGNLDTGFVHDPNGTSARIAETHRQEAWRNGNLPLIPTNSGPYGVFVHPWDPWSDISIQDYRGTFPRSGAIVQKNDGILHTAAVHAGFWDVYVGNGGPGTFGYPITNEAQQSVSNLDCLNDKCVTQKFKGGTKGEGAFVYNPAWPPGSWPNGTVRWCDNANSNGNCQWNTTLANDSAAGSEIHAALISLSTGQTEDFTASASATFELRIASVSYNRIELGITSDVQNLDDIAIYVDGMQEAIIPPQAIGHAITNLTPGTTYSIVMHGLVDNVGTVVTSEPLEVTTLPSPQTTLRLTSGISAIGTAYPDEFLYDSCATVTFTIGNDGTSPIALDQVKALATIDFVGQTLTRDFSHANFSPPLVLNPGDTYTYVGDN